MEIEFFQYFSIELGKSITIALDPFEKDSFVSQFRVSYYFPDILRFLLTDRTGIRKFVDIGANIGHMTISAAALGIECIAIEALSKNYVLLSEALFANRMTNVKAVHAAASSAAGMLLFEGSSAYGHVVARETQGTSVITEVPALSGDHLLMIHDFLTPDLIKIDVEGHELEVINGLRDTIIDARPLLIIESNIWTLGGIEAARTLLSTVENLRYNLYLFRRDGTVTPRPAENLQPVLVADYLAIPVTMPYHRAHPAIRPFCADDELSMIASEPLESAPHLWIACQALARLEEQGASSPVVDLILASYGNSGADIRSFVREHWLGSFPNWL